MEKLRIKIGFPMGSYVSCVGRSGGLALYWRNTINLIPQSSSESHIDAIVADEEGQDIWRLTGFYSEPVAARRQRSWDLLKSLNAKNSLPWLCVGDFNEILAQIEKKGGRLRNWSQIFTFRNTLDDYGFADLGYSGIKYTWSNGQEGNELVEERLDRAVANYQWLQMFHTHNVRNIISSTSDHSPILVSTNLRQHTSPFRSKPFRFEAMWTRESECTSLVEDNWHLCFMANPIEDMAAKISNMGEVLQLWNSTRFGNVTKKISATYKALNHVRGQESLTCQRKRYLKKELNELLSRHEIMWHQRSRDLWLKHGDKNTNFFHARATQRRRCNMIDGLMDEEGNWQQSLEAKANIITSYFQNLFNSDNLRRIEEALESMEPRVTAEQNAYLTKAFTEAEVHKALFQMHPLKAPGPDGVRICRGAPSISHLLFADDNLLYLKASKEECREILQILKLYEEASGQKINLQKSAMSFSKNVDLEKMTRLCNILQVRRVNNHEKYLGLPSMIRRNKNQIFGIIKDRLWQRVQGWKANLLSKADKEVLIKAVTQSIPTYAMSCFKLPSGLLHELSMMMARFWWGHHKEGKAIH